jgi:predicted nucleic acid-binding protein
MKIGLDANFIVDLLAEHSPRHPVTWACYEKHREAHDEFLIVENVLLEAFSALLRAPVGMSPREAVRTLEEHFGDTITAPIRRGLAWDTIHHVIARGFAGRRIYDAAIALAAFEAGATVMLTWNVRHFIGVAPVGLEIRQP